MSRRTTKQRKSAQRRSKHYKRLQDIDAINHGMSVLRRMLWLKARRSGFSSGGVEPVWPYVEEDSADV